ncbi:M16 family metallopeptidase [Chitinophaga lutea]
MQRIIYLFLCCLPLAQVSAQSTKELQVDGIKVIYKKTEKDVITVSVALRGGVANITNDQQGLEALAINTALEGGTTTIDKDALAAERDKLGTEFYANANSDFSTLNMACLKENWNRSWQLFSDAVIHPAMDEQEFKLLLDKQLASVKQAEADPDGYLRRLAQQQLFAGSDYGKRANGTSETLPKLTAAQAKTYYQQLLGKKNIFIVVVGNVDEADLKEKVRSSFGQLPQGRAPKMPVAAKFKPGVSITDRDIATNYIIGTGDAPKYFTPDGPLFEFAMSILYDRYFVELRTKRSLSYAPASYYNDDNIQQPVANFYITTIDPKQSLQVMTDIINDVKEHGFTEKEVNDKKRQYLTRFYRTNETSGGQATVLGQCEAAGNWRIFDEINSKIDQVTAADVNGIFRKYVNEVAWTYLGKKDKVQEGDFKQPVSMKQPPKVKAPAKN